MGVVGDVFCAEHVKENVRHDKNAKRE